MTSGNLGSKRICPKCDAKFYDFGAVTPITCPKCAHKWTEGGTKKPAAAKKEAKVPVKVVRKPSRNDDDLLDLAGDLPDVEDGDATLELEPMEDDSVEMTSLEEVEEHEEDEESDPNSDDAEDDMFTDLSGGDKIVDDFEDEDEEDDEDEDEEDEDSDDEDDDDEDDDDRPKRRRR